MSIMIGRVTGREIKANMDSGADKLLLQVEVTEPDDVRTIQLMTQAGEDCNPADDSQVLIVNVTDSFALVIGADDGIVPSMNAGERKLYSVAAGAIAAHMNLLNTGVIEINGNTDFAVKYNELKTAFDQLVSDFDSHLHSGVTTGGGTSGPPTASSTADMSGAKVDEVKL